jgi:hypothetical protein
VANNFPVMDAMQVAALQYSVVIEPLAGAVNWIAAAQYPLVSFQFSHDPGDGGPIVFDYTSFDQDTHETQTRALLTAICGAMAGNLGLDVASVQAAVTVQRVWTMTGTAPMMGAYPSCVVTDQMTYP